MAPSADEQMQSFIIRIWVEERAPVEPDPTWRGHVVHVASGRRLYFQALEDACEFVADRLEQQGINIR